MTLTAKPTGVVATVAACEAPSYVALSPDNATVAEKVCADLGLASRGTLTGADIAAMDRESLTAAALSATIFARVSPD